MIDAYYAHKLFDRVLASIDGLDRTVGGDPYLDAMRGNANLQKGDLAAAKRCARKVVEAEPDLPAGVLLPPHDFLEGEGLCRDQAQLTAIRSKFPRWMPNLKGNPAYTEYAASPQYRDWLNAKKP